ncbi:NeuD/PglB/VioB family sugar acetyltransferase [Salinibacterium sp. M195]|uniref:NeuD/PglB/VioB family sugar acetyltransferase n=1 Tax=Salinibacterium sp. M195 TaxID=2583374 RepID=UPI001C627905|nr:NeuD/PglB/VioB family sugar acetyltransferase [Salinibacterium sp. M195]QYH36963.1 acetyltransferase [Salinibacterium sp. M195]
MTRHPLLLIAAGGLAREVLAVVRESGHEVLGFLDDRHEELPSTISGARVLGGVDDVTLYPRASLLVCVGSGLGRDRVVARLSALGIESDRFATVIDPSVRNPAGCPIGAGSILLAGVVITTDAVIGEHVVVMPHVTITHDCRIGDFATLAAGVALGGGVRVGRGAFLGMNCSIRQGLTIGIGATVGMGAVVLSDVHPAETWAGIPARRLGVTE